MRWNGVGRKPLVLIVCTSVVLLLLSGCVLEENYRGEVGPRVSLLGDSVTDAAATALHTALDPAHRVRIGAVEQRPVADMQTAATQHAVTYPDVVVIQLGTFDAVSAAPASNAIAGLDTMLAKFPSSCAVLVNINGGITAPGFDVAKAEEINEALLSRADQLVDWSSAVASDPTANVAADGVLPTPAGAAVLADLVLGAVDACLPVNDQTPLAPSDLAPVGTVAATTPTLSAVYATPSGFNGRTAFTIWDVATSAVAATGDGSLESPGGRSQWTVPDGLLQRGRTYRWGAVNVDEYERRSIASPQVDLVLSSVALTAPADGDVLFNTTTLRATIAAGITPTQLDFLADGAVIGSRTAAPWELPWDTTAVAAGPHQLGVRLHTGSATTDSPTVAVTVDNTVSVGRRLDLDHQRGVLSTDAYTLAGLDSAMFPTTVTDPRYQGANDTPFLAYLANWDSLSPSTKEAVRQRFVYTSVPAPAGSPAAGSPGAGDATTAAEIDGCPSGIDTWLTTTFLGTFPRCHKEIRYPDASKNVPSLAFDFWVGPAADSVPEDDTRNNNGIPDYIDEMADNMFTAFLYYRDVLDLDVESMFGPDHPIPVSLENTSTAWVTPFGDHRIVIGTRDHSTDIARHEMAHVFQYNYLSTLEVLGDFCPSDYCQSSNVGFMEASADWAEHQVASANPSLPGQDKYYKFLGHYLKEPWRQMTVDYGPRHGWDGRAYGEFIFFEWFQEQQQVPADLMKRLYDGMHEPDDRTSIEVIRDIVNDAGNPFDRLLPAYWQAVYMLDDTVPGDDPATGLTRAFQDLDRGDWVTHLVNSNLPGSAPGTRGRPGHQSLDLPMDRSEVSVNGQIEPGGAAFVDLEPADTMSGTAEVVVTVPQDRADKYRASVLSWKGGIPNLCATIGGGGGGGSGGAEPAGGPDSGPASGADPRQGNQDPAARGQTGGQGGQWSSPSLNGVTTDLHITVPFTSQCTKATLVLTNIDPTDYDMSDDWAVKVRLDVIGGSLHNLDTDIGVNPSGELNIPGTGLGLSHRSEDALYPGCLCEGWGVADVTTGVWGGAYQSPRSSGSAGTTAGTGGTSAEGDLTVLDFQQTTGSITSRTGIGPEVDGHHGLEVEHVFSTATRPGGPGSTFLVSNMFEVKVTITNHGAAPAHPRYRRLMDWDVPPDAFNEHVTIGALGPVPPTLLRTSNDGFATTNPLVDPTTLGNESVPAPSTMFFDDVGPLDHGALFDFELGELAPGASRTFVLYYGAADDEAEAMGYLTDVSAQVYSLGQTHDDPGNPDFGPATGKPHTFIFAAKDL